MATVSVSTPVERPPDVVFGFIAADHVANHPRWDPMNEEPIRTSVDG